MGLAHRRSLTRLKASTFTLNSSNGGDGDCRHSFRVGSTCSGQTMGSRIGPGSLTTYLATATAAATLTFKWTYGTADIDGSAFDPAGYVLNDLFTQLTIDDGFLTQNGIVTLTVLAGQSYGFYIDSLDVALGRAHIAVSETPLPAALLLFASGLGVLRLFSRRRICGTYGYRSSATLVTELSRRDAQGSKPVLRTAGSSNLIRPRYAGCGLRLVRRANQPSTRAGTRRARARQGSAVAARLANSNAG